MLNEGTALHFHIDTNLLLLLADQLDQVVPEELLENPLPVLDRVVILFVQFNTSNEQLLHCVYAGIRDVLFVEVSAVAKYYAAAADWALVASKTKKMLRDFKEINSCTIPL